MVSTGRPARAAEAGASAPGEVTEPLVAGYREGTFRGAGELDLFYRRWRPSGEVRAVVAKVHGFGGHSGLCQPLVEHVVPRGYALYGLDLRGHGRSPGPRGHVDDWGQYREDLRRFLRLIEAEEPGAPHFLVGLSMGGLLALDYALHHPEGLRGVVALGPPLGQVGVSPLKLLLGRALARVWPRFRIDTNLDIAASSRDPAAVSIIQDDRLFFTVGTAQLGAEFLATIERTQARAAALRVPVLILHGTADRLALPEGSRRFYDRVTIADKELRLYEGGYHVLYWDTNRQEVLGDLERWLDRHLPQGPAQT